MAVAKTAGSCCPALAGQCLAGDRDDEIGPGLAIDETADLKKGKATACVSPQHAGVTGKVENCVTWVFAALVTATGQAWAWFDLYMPGRMGEDQRRRRKAGSRVTWRSRPSRPWRSRR